MLSFIYVNTPEQNGHIESFHKTLKKEYIWPCEFADMLDARGPYRRCENPLQDPKSSSISRTRSQARTTYWSRRGDAPQDTQEAPEQLDLMLEVLRVMQGADNMTGLATAAVLGN